MKKSPLMKLKIQCVKLAMKQYLDMDPYCEICGEPATTCHHFIYQSRSNYLRCDERNLVAICRSCHYKMHQGYEQIFTGQLIRQRGWDWLNEMRNDSNVRIKDNKASWEAMLAQLKGKK